MKTGKTKPLQNALAALALATSCALPAPAQVPPLLKYQGKVQDSDMTISGRFQFKFALVAPPRQATALAYADRFSGVYAIDVTDSGSGYTTAPLVTISGLGFGAEAHATISLGGVDSILIDDEGSGYNDYYAEVSIAPPSGNHFTFWSNNGTSDNGSEPDDSVSVEVKNGNFTIALGEGMDPIPSSIFKRSDVRLRTWFKKNNSFRKFQQDDRFLPVGYAMQAAGVEKSSVSVAGHGNANGGGTEFCPSAPSFPRLLDQVYVPVSGKGSVFISAFVTVKSGSPVPELKLYSNLPGYDVVKVAATDAWDQMTLHLSWVLTDVTIPVLIESYLSVDSGCVTFYGHSLSAIFAADE